MRSPLWMQTLRRMVGTALYLGVTPALAEQGMIAEAEKSTAAARRATVESPLQLEEFLRGALATHPKLKAARFKVQAAEASEMAARGAFDLKFYASGEHAPLGYYERSRVEVGFKQPTTLWGSELSLKYENGWDFPAYYGEKVTSEAGKASFGLLVPLLRDGLIDASRLSIVQRQIERDMAELDQLQAKVDLLADAATLWWKWVALGRKRALYGRMLEQAEERAEYLREQVRVGALARIETIDNDRLVLSRKATLAQVDLELKQTAFKMGLYRRDSRGAPLPPQSEELPDLSSALAAEPTSTQQIESDIARAPAVRMYAALLDMVERELRWAKNQLLPRLDLQVGASHAAGTQRYYSATEHTVSETAAGGSLTLALDVQRRKARGKVAALRNKRDSLEQELRLLEDTMKAEMQSALQALLLQHEIAQQNLEASQLAREMVAAEGESYQSGQSTIMNLNFREQAALGAELAGLEAIVEFQLARIHLQRVRGKTTLRSYLFHESEPRRAP